MIAARKRTRRVPFDLTMEEYEWLERWAHSKGFEQIAPAIRWYLRQDDGLPPVDVAAGDDKGKGGINHER